MNRFIVYELGVLGLQGGAEAWLSKQVMDLQRGWWFNRHGGPEFTLAAVMPAQN
ncbi:MAG: hypothetical protein ACOCUP_00270 [bacterium]